MGWSIQRMPSPSPFLGVFLDQIILSILEARNPTFGFRATYLEARFQSYLSQSQSPELSIFKQASRIGIQSYLSRSQHAAFKSRELVRSQQTSESRATYLKASKQSLGSTRESSYLKLASQAASIPNPKLSISKPAAVKSRAIYLEVSTIRSQSYLSRIQRATFDIRVIYLKASSIRF